MKLSVRLIEGFKKTYLPLQFRAFWDDEGFCGDAANLLI